MSQNIWIYAEQEDGKVNDSFYEMLSKAQNVAENLPSDSKIAAVVIGNELESAVLELRKSGVDIVYAVQHQKLSQYNPEYYPVTMAELAKMHHPLTIWVAASSQGAEIAPSVAAKLKTGLAAHCVDIFVNSNGEMVHIVPAFGGKVLSEILIPKSRPMMASVKPGIFRRSEISLSGEAEVIWEKATFLDGFESRIKLIAQEDIKVTGMPVEKAEVVVCGGLGVSNMENWEKVKKLAAVINAAVGYTRPVIDIELEQTDENMIGASGKSVRPKLYISFGVSGASHHVCGIKDSDMIISVNRDEKAEIFSASDYKVVADCGTILDALLSHMKSI